MYKISLILLLSLFTTPLVFAQKQGIKGLVSNPKGEKIMNCEIIISHENITQSITTDEAGKFLVNLEAGVYYIDINQPECELYTREIKVEKNKIINLTIKLKLKSEKSLEEVVVNGQSQRKTEANLINLQKKSVQIVENVSSEQLQKQGVGDVSTAVTKAAGIQKQESSGIIYVRGLGDRYNSTTLNGLPIPSDDPENKNIDLSIFKTSMVEYISLDKVYNPALNGDFSGANVNINSKGFNGNPYLKIGLSSGINLQTFDESNFRVQDGTPGFLGYNTTNFIKSNPYQKYPFKTNWNFDKQNNKFNSGLNIEGGRKFFDSKLSSFFYLGFDNNYMYRKGKEGFYDSTGDAIKALSVSRSTYTTNTTALLNLKYKINAKNEIKFYSNFIHTSEQDAKIYQGYMREVGTEVIINRGDNKITSTWINQLLGEHQLNDSWKLDWAASYNMLNSKRPDRLQNTIDAATMQFITGSAINNHRYFDDLKDNTLNGFLHLTKTWNDFKFNFGYEGSYKDRKFENTTIGMQMSMSPTVNPTDVDGVINASNNSLFTYTTFRSENNLFKPFYYNLDQAIHAGFVNIDYNITPQLIIQLGGRYDYIKLESDWDDSVKGIGNKNKNYSKILPSFNAKYSLNTKQNLRLAVSKTYTLPQPKEIIPIGYYDVTTNVYGNKYLKPSDNYNLDLKWEYFPTPGEIISVTAFGKYIKNAIAKTTYSTASSSDMSYFNLSKWGYVLGTELEFRKDVYKWNQSKIYTFLNGTFMHTEQKLKSENEISQENGGATIEFSGQDKEDLQGAAKILGNANLGFNHTWNDNQNKLDFVVTYAYVGKNLYAIGTNKTGNFYEKQLNLLDANFKMEFKNLGLGISAKNLLNPKYRIEQENNFGSFIHKDYTRGREIALSLSYKF